MSTKNGIMIIVLIFAAGVAGYYVGLGNSMEHSSFDMYRVNADCEKDAQAWAKNNSTELTIWSVNKNTFNIKLASCVAEFVSYDPVFKGDVKAIYNVTHNESLARLEPVPVPTPVGYDSDQQLKDFNNYDKIYNEVFLNSK